MGLSYRRPVELGLIRLNFTLNGLTSWTLRLGIASWNSRTQRWTINLPGRWKYTTKTRYPRPWSAAA